MGSYANFRIAGVSFFESKSVVDPTLMTIFVESDRRKFSRPRDVDSEDNIEDEEVHEYFVEARHAKRRLEVLGFTSLNARKFFAEKIRSLAEAFKAGSPGSVLYPIEDDEMDAFLNEYTYDAWCDALRTSLRLGYVSEDRLRELPPILRITSTAYHDEFHHGFPWSDLRLMVRAYLDAIQATEPVVMDITELIQEDYYSDQEPLAVYAKEAARVEFMSCAPIIVLTEGSTDVEFLEGALNLLHPELAPLYSFLDFQLPNLEGGAGNLVWVLKSLIGSGVANRVVALLDNDTAARDAMRGLREVSMPNNFVVQQYPSVGYANSYPTLGPTGLVNANVNGLAGGLEMYFGLDVLTDKSGNLTPVQWKGYNKQLNQYQGELVDKCRLQADFRIKLRMADPDADWTGIQAILSQLFNAFAHTPLDLA